MKNKLKILLATYNGEKFIQEQIDSLLNQTYSDFLIIIQDDFSTDKTFEILQRYSKKYPNKIFVSQNRKNSGSAKNNFISMIIGTEGDYFMLCDQDDIWKDFKVEFSIDKLKEAENLYGKDTPILIHTNAEVVDENLEILSSSLEYRLNLDCKKNKLNNYLSQNNITGCTTIFNKSVKNKIGQVPEFFLMHDWWLGLITSAFGIITYYDQATISYRQHGENSIGAQNTKNNMYKIKNFLDFQNKILAIKFTYLQANCFLQIYKQQLSESQKKLLNEYIDIPNKNKLLKIYSLLKNKFYKSPFFRTLGHIFFI